MKVPSTRCIVVMRVLNRAHCLVRRVHCSILKWTAQICQYGNYRSTTKSNITILQTISECRAKLDLCLLIDSSGSVRDNNYLGGPDNWKLQLDFFANLVAGYTIGQNDIRVAAIVFSDQARLVFPLNRFNNLRELQDSILDIPYMGQTTNTPKALHQADIQCFNAANGDRDDADNVIIIVTDGAPYPPDRRNPALVEARRLMNKGIGLVAVGVTDAVDENFLRGISTDGTYSMVEKFQELNKQKGQISRQICEMTQNGKDYIY